MDFRPDKHTNGLIVIFTKGVYYKAHILDIEMLLGNYSEIPLSNTLYEYLVEFVNYVNEKEREKEHKLNL